MKGKGQLEHPIGNIQSLRDNSLESIMSWRWYDCLQLFVYISFLFVYIICLHFAGRTIGDCG